MTIDLDGFERLCKSQGRTSISVPIPQAIIAEIRALRKVRDAARYWLHTKIDTVDEAEARNALGLAVSNADALEGKEDE